MYEDHYGLTTRPFQLTPDPRFWLDTATHRKAMAYLGYGLAQGEGFIVMTGDIGAGKTTLMGKLLAEVNRAELNVITIVSSQVAADDLLRTVCAGLDVMTTGMAKADMLRAIEKGLHAVARTGRRTLLVVDEVQALPNESLEELRMLSNFQAAGGALLQLILLGQPEFRDRLADPRLEQLRQRVIAHHHLGPMAADEVESYLAHRLSIAGWTGNPDFDPAAVAAIHDWSGGIPRRINLLTSRVLLHGAMTGITTFTAADVGAVIADLDSDATGEAGAFVFDLPEPVVAEAPAEPEPEPVEPVAAPVAPTRIPRPFLIDEEPVAAAPRPILTEAVEAAADDELLLTDRIYLADEASPATAPTIEARIAAIESRLEDQDDALRRVLTLLVDWVEAGGQVPGRAQGAIG